MRTILAFVRALTALIEACLPLIRARAEIAAQELKERQYHADRKAMVDKLAEGDPRGVEAAFAAWDEQLLSEGIADGDFGAEPDRQK